MVYPPVYTCILGYCHGGGGIRLIVGFQPLMVISPTASWIRWCMQVWHYGRTWHRLGTDWFSASIDRVKSRNLPNPIQTYVTKTADIHLVRSRSHCIQVTSGSVLPNDWRWSSLRRPWIPYSVYFFWRICTEEPLCIIDNVDGVDYACVMSSDTRSEKSKFTLLYHGAQCSRLEQFTACRNLLQPQIGGPKVLGLEQHATLLLEEWKIQTEMDTTGCHPASQFIA